VDDEDNDDKKAENPGDDDPWSNETAPAARA